MQFEVIRVFRGWICQYIWCDSICSILYQINTHYIRILEVYLTHYIRTRSRKKLSSKHVFLNDIENAISYYHISKAFTKKRCRTASRTNFFLTDLLMRQLIANEILIFDVLKFLDWSVWRRRALNNRLSVGEVLEWSVGWRKALNMRLSEGEVLDWAVGRPRSVLWCEVKGLSRQ